MDEFLVYITMVEQNRRQSDEHRRRDVEIPRNDDVAEASLPAASLMDLLMRR
jgi:hypothetical protein